ncbi:putative protein OS=Afipia felis OX=1035 GN=NCTC12722_00332 PE=4 SV=1 [Afipia felis]
MICNSFLGRKLNTWSRGICSARAFSLVCDKLTHVMIVPLPEIQPRDDCPARPGHRPDETNAPFMGIFGFSILGLLLCCLLARMPVARGFLSAKILLILMAAPVAAWLGFSLGGGD